MKKIIFGSIVCILVIFGLIFIKDDDTVKVVSYNGNNLRISIDGQTSSTLPTSGVYYLTEYDCDDINTVVTWNNEDYNLEVTNGVKKGNVACYLEFKSVPLLGDMPVGSYVKYKGDSDNGCDDSNAIDGYSSCDGKNANYESSTSMGYCSDSNSKFYVNGWRIGYTDKDGSAYLVSAGATDCMCTKSDGTSSSSSCSSSLSASDIYKHYDNMNNIALKYCNSDYAKGGVCDSSTTWAMNAADFKMITGSTLNSSSCYSKYSNISCGYTNDLIDNGGYYWFATPCSASSTNSFSWYPYDRAWTATTRTDLSGLRPVLYLESSVQVIGGSGTYEDPYLISNNTFKINDSAKYVSSNDDLSNIQLKLTAGDDVTSMCINVNSSVCNDYIPISNTYTLDWSSEADGEKIVYVYYKNSNDEIVATMNRSIIMDTVAPTNNSVLIADGVGLTRVLSISSTGATTMCLSNTSSNVSDCSNWISYSTNTKWRLTDGIGTKTVYVFFKDIAGNVSSTSATVEVTSIVEFVVNEDFADGQYDSNITITDGSTYPWSVVNGQFQSTNQGVKSSTSSSTISFTPTLDAVLSFDYGVSSESNYDKLTITLSGSDSSSNTLVSAISGTTTGSINNINLTSGVTYTLTLSYVKDSSTDKNSDIGYIDNLNIQS